MLYSDYLKRASERFSARFHEIDPEWNFDLGNEFEVTLAILLDEMLPDKYGVCRGFVTPQKGDPKGDDIIIYDQLSAPLLRPSIEYKFTRKEYVPLEATYVYIEAKNTLELIDVKKNTYIQRAVDQTRSVKKLHREPRKISEILHGVNLGNGFTIPQNPNQPQIYNPMYTVVFARGARINGTLVEDPKQIISCLSGLDLGDNSPDLMVIGKDLILTPHHVNPFTNAQEYEGPFLINDRHTLVMNVLPDLAYGFGLTSILYALQKIKLKNVPWQEVLKEAFLDVANVHNKII